MNTGRVAVFLDRDGTIIREYGHFWEPSMIELVGGAADAIRRLKACGFMAIVTTNQGGIARGIFDERQFWIGEHKMEELLEAEGIKLDAVYFCPHHPTEGDSPYRADCECRKPKPGMILRAAREYGIDLTHSYMVGDSDVDVGAGNAAGVRTVKLDTAYGRGVAPIARPDVVEQAKGERPKPSHQAPTLAEASHWIIQQGR